MSRRRFWLVAAGVSVLIAVLGAVAANQAKVYRGRQARAAMLRDRYATIEYPPTEGQLRDALFRMLRPVTVANCRLERFGEAHDGGYLMCGNLLGDVEAGYSYGIAGYDKWGCDISSRLGVSVHQYDCFDTTRPACPRGDTVFHEECVGRTSGRIGGRLFDTMANQFGRNGDRARRVVLKMDVEGAEWDSLLSAPDDVLQQIDQMAVEFHWARDANGAWVDDDKHLHVVDRLKEFFEIAHVHFNNASCTGSLEPFPTWAYEVLFVSRRLAVVDPATPAGGLHRLDAPNNPSYPDCQPESP